MPRLPRLVALWTLVLHVLVAGVVPLAHARVEAGSRRAEARVHVEAPGNGNCLAVHDDLGCQLCSLVRLAGHPAARDAHPPAARGGAGPPDAAVLLAADPGALGRLRARAPPLA